MGDRTCQPRDECSKVGRHGICCYRPRIAKSTVVFSKDRSRSPFTHVGENGGGCECREEKTRTLVPPNPELESGSQQRATLIKLFDVDVF